MYDKSLVPLSTGSAFWNWFTIMYFSSFFIVQTATQNYKSRQRKTGSKVHLTVILF